ncbi:DUF4276 family protein [Pseudodesulfovibrio sp.]|uniref:DUF4276 family protein n=1 Tax=Pseudodesulfovibrio sp. TaxID=2035812 RepID=UPI00260FAC81|nr:DUF4276 family protein [Pseudodesulfovibrio sp.]MDD3311692.1 DUF4276 family protein [Pseudodesulfovibrio sp.]
MSTLVFFLEEPSAKEMLQGILPRILPNEISVQYHIFQGKQDLEKHLVKRLQGWRTPNCHFIIMRDQDAGDCRTIKKNLALLCLSAGRNDAIVRIACRELESFYLGDLQAVETGLEIRGLAKLQSKKKFRTPDTLHNPAEELYNITNKAYQKLAGSRLIGPHLSLTKNESTSFNQLLRGIEKLVYA